MRVLICWAELSGYMSACWRALARSEGFSVSVIALKAGALTAGQAPFADCLVAGLNCRLLSAEEKNDEELIVALARQHRPEVIIFAGWANRAYRRLAFHPAFSDTRLVMMMDNPFLRSWRQRFARIKIGRYLDRMDRVFVSGERSWQLARYLKVPEAKIRRGTYGIDCQLLAPIYDRRAVQPQGWPRRFLFIGRYAEAKGIDVLLSGYKQYGAAVDAPWPLDCCGSGPLQKELGAASGVADLGFIQPADMPEVWLHHGVFVIASRFDPWPLVVVEACAAGLPVVCTEACGSAVEVVRPYFNGLVVHTGDGAAIAQALSWMHHNHDKLSAMGARGRPLAAAYSAEMWAQRVSGVLAEFSS